MTEVMPLRDPPAEGRAGRGSPSQLTRRSVGTPQVRMTMQFCDQPDRRPMGALGLPADNQPATAHLVQTLPHRW
jgi:hypothetical protein